MDIQTKITGLLLAASACGAIAQQSADITVVGGVAPGPCSVTLAGGGTADYGTLVASSLNTAAPNQLGSLNIGLSISCLATTQVAITVVDNDASSSVPSNTPTIVAAAANGSNLNSTLNAAVYRGLGLAPNSAPIGNYIIALTNADANGSNAGILQSNDDGLTWTINVEAPTREGRLNTWVTPGGVAPLGINNASLDLKITAAIDDMTALNGAVDDIAIAGSSTVSVIYL